MSDRRDAMPLGLLRALLAALALACLVGLDAAPGLAQVNPTADSVNEEALFEALGGDQPLSGRVSIPNQSAADLIKPSGRDWTATHNRTLLWLALGASGLMLLLLAGFYLVRGRIPIERGFSGRTVVRFNGFERFAHWLTAVSFILLALTGLNILVGRHVLLPVIGEGAFGALSQWGKYAHNYLAWAFMLGLLLVLVLWIRGNIPSRRDVEWLRAGGGFLGNGKHPQAHRFNAGQKLIFWSVVIGGVLLSYTGILLLFPELTGGPNAWQLTQVVHSAVAGIMIAIMLAHIYIGTIGMEGAFPAMGSGEVDLNWAREHHRLWLEEKYGAGAEPGPQPAAKGPRGSVAPAE
jgi:formate dehydrogenase subunit gamma